MKTFNKVIETSIIGRTIDGRIVRGYVSANNLISNAGNIEKKKNCPNCGAPVECGKSGCAYCGTKY